MRGFIVLCLCATAFAAPQGYNYQQQQQQQQQNGFSLGLPNFNTNLGETTKTNEGHGFLQQAIKSTNFQQTLLGGGQTATQQFSAIPNFQQYHTSGRQQAAVQPQNFGYSGVQQQQQPIFASANFGGHQQQQQAQQYQGFQQQQYQGPPTVTKDIYVHVAPEEPEEQHYQAPVPQAPPRKHYRIVFIKAPTQKLNTAALRITSAPTEEKTIIYVLTKKPDPLDLQAAIQEIKPKQPSKPEVYFIKYKTQEEAQHAQRTIQAQYDQLGGTSQVSDEGIAPVHNVIGSLDGLPQQQQQHQQQIISNEYSNGGSSYTSSSSASSSGSSGTSKYLPPIVKL